MIIGTDIKNVLKSKHRKIVFDYGYCGLGTRLKQIAWGKTIAKVSNSDYLLIWFKTWDCGGKEMNPLDIITNVDFFIPKLDFKVSRHIYKNNTNLLRYWESAEEQMKEKYKDVSDFLFFRDRVRKNLYKEKAKFPLRNNIKKHVRDFWFADNQEKTYDDLYTIFLRMLQNIQPSKTVSKKVESYNVDNFIGVHVRRGDVISSACRVNVKKYFDFIDSRTICHDKKIFLCTENQKVINGFKERYKNRIICRPLVKFHRNSLKGIQNAYADMLLLSKCDFIIGGKSHFSDISATIGGIKKKTLG